jgi:hypothetical protein
MHIFSMLHNFYYSKNVALLRPYGQFSSHNQINKVALKKNLSCLNQHAYITIFMQCIVCQHFFSLGKDIARTIISEYWDFFLSCWPLPCCCLRNHSWCSDQSCYQSASRGEKTTHQCMGKFDNSSKSWHDDSALALESTSKQKREVAAGRVDSRVTILRLWHVLVTRPYNNLSGKSCWHSYKIQKFLPNAGNQSKT